MIYLLLSTLLLTGCTLKVVLPTEPIPMHQATLQSGEDLVNDVMRVSIAEPPIEPSAMQRTIAQICKPQREANDNLKEDNKDLYDSLVIAYGINVELRKRVEQLQHELAIMRHER